MVKDKHNTDVYTVASVDSTPHIGNSLGTQNVAMAMDSSNSLIIISNVDTYIYDGNIIKHSIIL